MIVFCDESGRTGTQKYHKEWNFNKQPFFVLCGIGIPINKLETMKNDLEAVLRYRKIQGELKYSKEMVRKVEDVLFEDFRKIMFENECKIFIEAVNKKFSIVQQIVNYCVFPYYDSSEVGCFSLGANFLRRNFANYLFLNIDDELLGKFVEMFDSNQQDKEKLIKLCKELISVINNKSIVEYIEETMDSIEHHQDFNLLIKHLFPLVDFYKNRTSAVAVCPHIDSFNNILSRITVSINKFQIIHDEVNELSDALPETVRSFSTLNQTDISFGFEKSKHNLFVQLADFYAGSIRSKIEDIIIKKTSNNLNITLETIIQNDLNFVSGFDEQIKMFPKNMDILQWNKWYVDFFESE